MSIKEKNIIDEISDEIELDDIEVNSQGTSFDMPEDYSFVRKKLIKSIVRGSEILDQATIEAKTAPSPRVIEVASQSVRALTEVSKELITLHEKIRKIEHERIRNNPTGNEINTEDDAGIILKSTLSDLLEQIEKETS